MTYQLRDEHGASRSVSYLMLPGGPFIFVTFLLAPGQPVSHLVAVAVTCTVLAVGGLVARFRPQWMPRWFWFIAPFFAIMIVTGLNLATEDASTGAQLFYLWPVLYSANFLSRRVVYATMTGVSITEALVVFPLLPATGDAVSDWVSLTVAMTLIAIVVVSLRNRGDRLREVLEAQALADSLTGVANRRCFDAELTRTVAWARTTGEPIALLTIDVDHFKRINDTWGHAVGDQALLAVAGALREAAKREGDVVARLGGDEFVLLLRTDRAGARHAADEIRSALARVGSLPGGPPGLSIGVALLPDHARSPEELLGASDAALYEAKLGGRGRTAVAEIRVRESVAPR